MPSSWWPDLSRTLLQLEGRVAPIDRSILASLFDYLERNSLQLTELANTLANTKASVDPPTNVHKDHPGSLTLFRYRDRPSAGGVEILIAAGLCALLEASEPDLQPPKRLLSMVRGALKKQNSPLSGALGAISSIPELIGIVENDEATRRALPPDFIQLWDSWLRDKLTRWMVSDPGRLRTALEGRTLTPQVEDSDVPLSLEAGQAEDAVSVACCITPPQHDELDEPTCIRVGRAKADLLERRSTGDLMAPPDFHLPRAIDERLCQGSVSAARKQIERDSSRAEPFVSLSLTLAAIVRESDLRSVVWGGPELAAPYAIDPASPVLYRLIKRPPEAVTPPKALDEWLKSAIDVLAWPLPKAVHELLLQLNEGVPTVGRAVLPRMSGSAKAPYRLHDVIAELEPGAKVGVKAPRLRFASELSALLGTEVAQLALADTFGMSSVPAYYSSMPEAHLAKKVAEIQARRFGEAVAVPEGRSGYFGSRLTLTEAAGRRWPRMLRKGRRAAGRSGDHLAEWRAHRDHLAGALCSATGHRPEDALGRIFLSDVIPEYHLIILQDKQADAFRSARIAAVGRLWLSDLRWYLDRLVAIATQHGHAPEGALAAAVLRSEEPLFTAAGPDGLPVRMTAAELRNGMPEELRTVGNFYRHRLNQGLLREDIDTELRHAQMGWVVSGAHLFANLSPSAPASLGSALAPIIDELLASDGWYPASFRERQWSWNGVPMPQPRDWEEVFSKHEREHQEALKRIKARLRERWKEHEPAVLQRLASALQEFCPGLRLDIQKREIVPASLALGPVEVKTAQHTLIRDRVRLADEDPSSGLEAVMAMVLLHRLVRRARNKNYVRGPIPSRPSLSITSEPSPFVPGLGDAVRQAFAIRGSLQKQAATGRVKDQGQLATWSVVAFSMYRRLPWARAAVAAAGTAIRGRQRRHFIRISARTDAGGMHMVFSGVPAILLANRKKRRAQGGGAPSSESLERWARANLSFDTQWGGSGEASRRIEATLAAAGQIELSGIARYLFQAGPRTAAVSPTRCTAHDDGWPIHASTGVFKERTDEPALPPFEAHSNIAAQQRPLRAEYDRFVGRLNRRQSAARRATGNEKKGADGAKGWRRSLKGDLKKLLDEPGQHPNLKVLIGYASDHLTFGSEAGNSLAQNSLRREVVQFGWPLLLSLGSRSLIALSGDEIQRLYRELLLSKSDASRPYVLEELRRFHGYLSRSHSAPGVDFCELAALAGGRQVRLQPGLLTDPELGAVLEVLQDDYGRESKRLDASPEFLRLAQMRQAFFLLLDASGVRPGSVYGLTLADVHLGDEGDFLHIRRGEYGEAKTSTSLGFVPLTGALWFENRPWVVQWLNERRRQDSSCDTPLFASRPRGRARVNEHQLTKRINALLKWVSGEKEAGCYWLRKTRISSRFGALATRKNVTARDVHGALTVSGHAWIQTTIERYINDPANLLLAELQAAVATPRAALLAMSGVQAGPLDAAWHRAGKDLTARLGIVLDRVGMHAMEAPAEHWSLPPKLPRFKPLRPAHVDVYARAMQRLEDQVKAALEAGVTQEQAKKLDQAASELSLQRGFAPWNSAIGAKKARCLPVPRRLEGTDRWFELLEKEAIVGLMRLSRSWAAQPYVQEHYGEGVVMRLDSADMAAVAEFMVKTGLEVKVVDDNNGRHLLVENALPHGRQGHGAAVRWVLSVIWIYVTATEAAVRGAPELSESPPAGQSM